MIKSLFINFLLVLAGWQVQAQVVEITPQKPKRGERVTVTYRPDAAGAVIGKDAASVEMSFAYSTFYELPYKLPMKKQGDQWVASFVLQRYATFACFTVVSGDKVDRPSPDSMYAIPVYDAKGRIFSSYMHEAYSLSAQMPKSPLLQSKQLELYQKELSLHPDNYEAKVRVQAIRMAAAKTSAERERHRQDALKIIAAKLEENPTFSGNINKVTMGYLIVGEKTRTDSVRRVVAERFPNSDQGKSYRIEAILREQDTIKKIAALETLLKKSDEAGEEGSKQIHSILFDHYAAEGNVSKATYHARKSLSKPSPYTAEELKEVTAKLTARKIAPDTAIAYATRSLNMVEQWPVGVIRYFPEFGHILPYVADSVRSKAVAEARAEIFSLLSLNHLYKDDSEKALQYARQSESAGFSRAGLMNVSAVYDQLGKLDKSLDILWKVVSHEPSDLEAVGRAKSAFIKNGGQQSSFQLKLDELVALRIKELKPTVKKLKMHAASPELNGITDLKGNKITPQMMKGKIVVLDFWATWCVPCMQEMPYLQNVYDKYKDNPNVMFMVVNTGANNTIKDAINWAAKNTKYSFPLYFNNDKNIGEKVGFTVIPTVAVLDKQGRMQFRTIGFEGAELEYKLSAQLEVLLEE